MLLNKRCPATEEAIFIGQGNTWLKSHQLLNDALSVYNFPCPLAPTIEWSNRVHAILYLNVLLLVGNSVNLNGPTSPFGAFILTRVLEHPRALIAIVSPPVCVPHVSIVCGSRVLFIQGWGILASLACLFCPVSKTKAVGTSSDRTMQMTMPEGSHAAGDGCAQNLGLSGKSEPGECDHPTQSR
jgi:hypothetical protein